MNENPHHLAPPPPDDGLRAVEAKGFQLLPPAPGKCRCCAVAHRPEEPHDAQSLYYQTRFNMKWKRPGTWADACAHCAPEVRALWREELTARGHWTEPPAGTPPIAEPIDH